MTQPFVYPGQIWWAGYSGASARILRRATDGVWLVEQGRARRIIREATLRRYFKLWEELAVTFSLPKLPQSGLR